MEMMMTLFGGYMVMSFFFFFLSVWCWSYEIGLFLLLLIYTIRMQQQKIDSHFSLGFYRPCVGRDDACRVSIWRNFFRLSVVILDQIWWCSDLICMIMLMLYNMTSSIQPRHLTCGVSNIIRNSLENRITTKFRFGRWIYISYQTSALSNDTLKDFNRHHENSFKK